MVFRKQKRKNKQPKAVKSVLHIPDLLLRLHGQHLARLGKGTCDAYIDKCVAKCTCAENRMCAALESHLRPVRTKAKLLAAGIKNANTELESILPKQGLAGIAAVRADREINRQMTLLRCKIRNGLFQLNELDEQLTSGRVLLSQRVKSLRRHTTKKLTAFVQGVRSSRRAQLGDYRQDSPIAFSEEDISGYMQTHVTDDALIHRYASGDFSDKKE